ncbi:MAG TPA: glycogen-binding domain-containing protein [Gemmatimonadaceae bacterium]
MTALLFVARAGQAQRVETSLDIGAVALRYADTLSTGAATVTPHLLADWGSAIVEASGTYSHFTSGGGSSGQGTLSGSRFISTEHRFFLELGGFAGGSTHSDGTRTGEALANGRIHIPRDNDELFLGVGGGRTWDGIAWRSVLLGEAGASIDMGSSNAMVTVTPTIVNDSIKYADTQASISRKGKVVDLGLLLGFRSGDQLTTLSANVRAWASASAVVWMTPRIGLVLAGGNYPVDPTQGFPGGRFASLSIRLSQQRRPNPISIESAPSVSRAEVRAAPAVTGFVAQRGARDAMTVRVNAPGARTVEINGDFTNWIPVSLVLAGDGWWASTFLLRRGKYQLNLRVNGGDWTVPPGLLSLVDEFGGTVGLLVVE